MADKVRRNKTIRPLRDPGDFYAGSAAHVESILGKDAARDIEEAAGCGVISTADHHGAFFCAQPFQGDYLFGELLRKLGYGGRHVPLHSGSQVELGSATYARGFYTYTSEHMRMPIPVFPYKDKNRLTSHTKAVTREMIDAFYKRLDETEMHPGAKDAIRDMCRPMYGEATVPKSGAFADQTMLTGIELSKLLFRDGEGPLQTYVELEAIATPLLREEIRDPGSLIANLLFDPRMRKCMQEVVTPEGTPVSGLLFRNADDKGRKSLLDLTPDGELTGTGWHGEEFRYRADAEDLCRLLDEKRIFPGLFLIFIIIGLERGITWMGGMFQSQYLPVWQRCLVRTLEEGGLKTESELFASYECDGYISGPAFMAYEGEGFANCAGPLEVHMYRPEWGAIREQMLKTGLWNGHLIDLSEIYYDILHPNDREEGWHENIVRELYHMFPENVLRG